MSKASASDSGNAFLDRLWDGCGFAGVHGLQTYSAGTVQLTPGPHSITVLYNQVTIVRRRSHC